MTMVSTDPAQLYVVGSVWHMVDGPGSTGSGLGPIYTFRCYRWIPATEARARGLFRGKPAKDEPICGDCQRFGADLDRSGAFEDAD